jgi:16S rRNA (guanine527-N7)-methyltransferase
MLPTRIAELLQPFVDDPGTGESRGRAALQRRVKEIEKIGALAPVSEADELSADLLASISTYIDILIHWNARVNLTAIRNPEEIVTRHFGESLFAARHLFPPSHVGTAVNEKKEASAPEFKNRITLADIGSGAGFPGIPIKLWAPHIALTLIESNHKKATFLRETVRALTLTDVNILTARAESITNTSFDVITLRAVERFESILPIAARLIAPRGRLALLIGSNQQSVARHALPDLSWSDPLAIPLSHSGVILIAEKATPASSSIFAHGVLA